MFGLVIGMAAVREWFGIRERPTLGSYSDGVIVGAALGAFVIWPLLVRGWRKQR